MASIDYPKELAPAFWNPHKAVLGKLKGVPVPQLAEGLAELAKRHNAVDWTVFDPSKIDTLATAQARLKGLDDEIKSKVREAQAQAGSMADLAESFGRDGKKNKAVPKEPIAAAAAIAKAALHFRDELGAAATRARGELDAVLARLQAVDKKGGAGQPPASPKAIADAKTVAALIKKSVALLRSPKGSPVPVRFFILQQDKTLRLYLGPKPDAAFARLKSQFATDAKLRRIKDPKGSVIWEKSSLTFVSEILKGGLAKPIQIAIREQARFGVKVRVKKADGSVEEGDSVADLTEDQLRVEPADEKEMLEAGKDFARRLGDLQPQISAALKGASPDRAKKIKALVVSVQSNGNAKRFVDALDDLDEIESLLDQGDGAGDEQGEDEAEAKAVAVTGPAGGVPPARAFAAKLSALMPKIRDAIADGGDIGKKIKTLVEQAGALAKTGKDAAIEQAADRLGQVEDLLGQIAAMSTSAPPAGGGLSVQRLTVARLEWIKTRDAAISEITRLSRAIVDVYRGETDQQQQVKAAITRLAALTTRLKTGLEDELDAALSENDAARRVQLVKKAKSSLVAIRKLVDEDDLMQSLDGNEILGDMHVVAPMKAGLRAIEIGLG